MSNSADSSKPKETSNESATKSVTSTWYLTWNTKFKPGDVVYYKGYLAKVLCPMGKTRFKKIQKYFVEPYPDQMKRAVVKETKIWSAQRYVSDPSATSDQIKNAKESHTQS